MTSYNYRSNNFELYPHQKDAISRLRDGCVLNGGVGSGKTLTSLSYYLQRHSNLNLYVITTAKKRDTKDWEVEAGLLGIKNLVVDSWNNIKRYNDIYNQFFIFDEQRAIGYNTWAKTFIRIAKRNKWIMCTATPGDTWMDYIPLFVANGFFKNKTDFVNNHVIYAQHLKFPKVERYINQGRLLKMRNLLLVDMDDMRHTKRIRETISVEYDTELYRKTIIDRWNPFKDKPIENPSELVACMRQILNSDISRQTATELLVSTIPKLIVFYNFDYELDLLRSICTGSGKPFTEWNGHKHESIPISDEWVYLVQYTAGSEAWNCTETDSMLFYSLNYSYRITEQCEGRIDRVNTPFTHLKYYYLESKSSLDKSIRQALRKKQKFNERKFVENARA